MFKYTILLVILICDSFNCAAVDSHSDKNSVDTEPPNFCDYEKLCPASTPKHIACIRDPNIQYKSNFFVQPLDDEHREIILHRLNSFRDSLAIGNITHFTKSQGITNMRLLMWDNMYQYLSDLMILRLTKNEYGCIATAEESELNQFKIIRIYNHTLYPISDFLDELFAEITTIIVDRTQPNDASTKIFSYLYNPITSRIGCSVGYRSLPRNNTEFLIRCISDGKQIKQFSEVFQYGKPCEKCDKCSDYYPGLCEPMLLLPDPVTEKPQNDGKNSSMRVNGFSWVILFCFVFTKYFVY